MSFLKKSDDSNGLERATEPRPRNIYKDPEPEPVRVVGEFTSPFGKKYDVLSCGHMRAQCPKNDDDPNYCHHGCGGERASYALDKRVPRNY